MNINLTIVVQGIHFFIAYLIIRFLFVKPGMKELASDKVELQRLSEALGEKKLLFDLKEAEQLKGQKMFWQDVLAHMPPIRILKAPDHFPSLDSLPDVRPEVAAQLVHDVQEEIVKRLNHVEL